MRQIFGYEGLYSITADGRIWSEPKSWAVNRGARLSHDGKWMSVKPHRQTGYLAVHLRKDGRPRRHYVHRLVAVAFVQNPDCKPEVNHKNNDVADARADNLEWVTAEEQHHPDRARIKRPHRNKLAESAVLVIYALRASGLSPLDVGREYGVGAQQIYRIWKGRHWRGITSARI